MKILHPLPQIRHEPIAHENLTYHFEGRGRRLTDVFGSVVKEMLA